MGGRQTEVHLEVMRCHATDVERVCLHDEPPNKNFRLFPFKHGLDKSLGNACMFHICVLASSQTLLTTPPDCELLQHTVVVLV